MFFLCSYYGGGVHEVVHVHRLSVQLAVVTRCIIVFAKSRRLELGDNTLGHYRSTFNHCDIIGLKICRIP